LKVTFDGFFPESCGFGRWEYGKKPLIKPHKHPILPEKDFEFLPQYAKDYFVVHRVCFELLTWVLFRRRLAILCIGQKSGRRGK
jgi:hypothetical protein